MIDKINTSTAITEADFHQDGHLETQENTSPSFADNPRSCAAEIIVLGTLVGETQRGVRIRKFDLKKRSMIGNTSMNPELSFIMANMVQARPNSLVLDPFCGTGAYSFLRF